jgi:hypothetical protein
MELVHPLYLDVPMMVSFLAALHGEGVAFEGEELARTGSGESHEKGGRGRVGLPGIGSLLGFDLSGRFQSVGQEEESRETKVLRKHTEASLFNLLRHRLIGEGRVGTLGTDSGDDLEVGQLVECGGGYVGNALQELIDSFFNVVPYAGLDEDDANAGTKKNPRKSGNPARRAQAEAASQQDDDEMSQGEIVRMMKIVRDDLRGSAVEDAVIQADDFGVVITMSKEFLSDATRDQMLAAELRVIGKVARVLAPGETINLTRRTAIGAMGPGFASSLVSEFSEGEELHLDLGDPVVESPGIQIQPLAVFL